MDSSHWRASTVSDRVGWVLFSGRSRRRALTARGHVRKRVPDTHDPEVIQERKPPDNANIQFLTTIPLTLQTVLLLIASNVFMTFAWYGHLKNLATAPWYIAAMVSWGIALFEYLLQVPANRIGFQQAGISVAQLKIMQEVITLGAVYFIFRSA